MAQISYTIQGSQSAQQSDDVDLEQLLHPLVFLKTDLTESSIIVEDGDTFQCGKCLHQFSFVDFIIHKKNICTGIPLSLADDEAQEMLSPSLPTLEGEVGTSAEDNKNQQLVVGFEGDVFSFKVDGDTNQNSILVEPFQEFGELGGPTIRIIENDDTNEVSSPIIGNNYLLSHNIKESSNEILAEDISIDKIDVINPTTPENLSSDINENSSSILKDINDDDDEDRRETEIAQQILFRSELAQMAQMKCLYCSKEFRKNFDLQQHMRSHTGERPFQCVVCGRAFAQKSNVIKHMATHKVWPKKVITMPKVPQNLDGQNGTMLIEKMFVCQYCPSVFKNYLELKAHRIEHVSQKVFKCVQKSCPETFKDLDDFLQHTQSHTDRASYECHLCHLEFSSLDDLGQHQIFHEGSKSPPKQLICTCCRAKFKSSESLEKHLLNDSHNYACPTCNRVFSSERFLRRHLKIHSSELKFTCPVCCKHFRTEHYLNVHMITHSFDKPFVCEICSATFNRKDRLGRHKLSHENAKRFKCPLCFKEFNRNDKLKQHMATHTTKYVCKHCFKQFSSNVLCGNHEFMCGAKKKQRRPSMITLSGPLPRVLEMQRVLTGKLKQQFTLAVRPAVLYRV